MKNVMMGILGIYLTIAGATAHAVGLNCALYEKSTNLIRPEVLTFTLELTSPEGMPSQYTGKIYYGGQLSQEVTDMVGKTILKNGRWVIGSRSKFFIELQFDNQTGDGIFYNGFGQDVKCHGL